MFSATWPKEVQRLASDFMADCSHITLGKAILNANQNIHQIVDVCEEFEKESKYNNQTEQKKSRKSSKKNSSLD